LTLCGSDPLAALAWPTPDLPPAPCQTLTVADPLTDPVADPGRGSFTVNGRTL